MIYDDIRQMTDDRLVLHYQELIKTKKALLAEPLSPYEWVNDNANDAFGRLWGHINDANNEMLFRGMTPGGCVI